MKTLLVIAQNGRFGDDVVYAILHADTGEFLASHVCSDRCFAYGDLYGNRKERQEEWASRFGEMEVKHLDETDISEDEMFRRNKLWYDSLQEEPDIPQPKIELTFTSDDGTK